MQYSFVSFQPVNVGILREKKTTEIRYGEACLNIKRCRTLKQVSDQR